MQITKKSFNLINSKNDTNNIQHTTLKQKQQAPRLTWEIKGQYKTYNPTLNKYNFSLNGYGRLQTIQTKIY